MPRPVIFYRESQFPKEELEAAQKYFFCTNSRMKIESGDLVIGRYSVLPFYREQEEDIRCIGAQLINSLRAHSFVADVKNYAEVLGDLTPKTWYRLQDVPKDSGPFVLKGATNSKKHSWSTHMYAETWSDVLRVHSLLQEDSMIGAQDIYTRKYIKLKQLGTAIGGLPLTHEFRFFVLNGQVVSGGFYWDAFHDDVIEQNGYVPDVNEVPKEFIQEVIEKIGDEVPFYVVDVAKTDEGNWIVIELNDGQMSGLSANPPKIFYKNLYQIIFE